jgi:hypothetical protein
MKKFWYEINGCYQTCIYCDTNTIEILQQNDNSITTTDVVALKYSDIPELIKVLQQILEGLK